MVAVSKGKSYYDLKEIENIPILDVCSHFGIPVSYQGQKPWCKLRPNEKTASTILHTEDTGRYKANTFYDFGVHESGNNITLACMMLGLNRDDDADRYHAIQYLAEAFHIAAKGHDGFYAGSLTNSQYAKIGLYGDLATKNFRFDTAHMDLEKIREISEKYAIPMNQLKKDHPYTFERLLKRISIPLIEEARNSLYMDIWVGRESVQKAKAAGELVFQRQDYDEDIRWLRDADAIFDRAIIGTRLKSFQNKEYDPDTILKKIDSGEIKPKFGSRSFRQMQKLAKRQQTIVKYRALEVCPVYLEGADIFGEYPYSAFLDKGKAMVGYLEKDLDALRPVLDRFAWRGSDRLNDRIDAATQRIDNTTPAESNLPVVEQQL